VGKREMDPVVRTAPIARALLTTMLLVGFMLTSAAASSAAMPPIKHVFVVIDENESEATSFGQASPAPYLSKTLVSKGAYLRSYYGIGHNSLDNYIAMVSGQAPNPMTSADCGTYADFGPTNLDSAGQETGEGCVYPANVPTLMGQLQTRRLTWRGYMDGMGANPLRESASCGHPLLNTPDLTEAATPTDQYASRHDPFVYFHSVIDNASLCDANVVNLDRLPGDLSSAAKTPNYVFITPNLCDDGHDAKCANGGPGGLPQADTFLKAWVPRILASPAYKQGGLLIVTFDEAVGDSTACCGERPGPYDYSHGIKPGGSGPGGGVVGAVLISPFIKPGTVSNTPYNHYSMLGSIEDDFGLARLAYAKGTTAFGSDIFNQAPRLSRLKLKPASWSARRPGTKISYSDSEPAVTTFAVLRRSSGYRFAHGACKTLAAGRSAPKHSARCTVTKRLGSFRNADAAGTNTVRFSGRLRGKRLGVGSYELVALPKAGPLIGASRTVEFKVKSH
jgi:phosphatidylinositol-3-phosphatase